MSLKSFLSIPFALYIRNKNYKWANAAKRTQLKVLKKLVKTAKNTSFGKDHQFEIISTYSDFKKLVPIRNYEAFTPYVNRLIEGESNVLWKGKPLYLSKTSGTTSGAKYIPISKESIPYHIDAARDAILHYIAETRKVGFVNRKMIFLQGSPKLSKKNSLNIGRLSGIVAHYVPKYLLKNRMPSERANIIEDWEQKIKAICKETLSQDMSLISGIPPWVQMYFETLLQQTNKQTVAEVFPNFSLLIYGGVNYEPYKVNLNKLIGKKVDSIELYPASEGFIAFQDKQDQKGMLLLLNSGIFYEFIPVDKFYEKNPPRLAVWEVELGVNYVIILSTNAGLWGYNIGDTVKFTSKDPYRIVVSGRLKHFTSAFGEHVIAEEVEKAMALCCQHFDVEIVEFHLAPQVNPERGELPYHEWFVELKDSDKNMPLEFASALNENMAKLNSYYNDLIEGKVLQPLKIRIVKENGFVDYMKSVGKLGGQNKLPRLANDRILAERLTLA